MKKIGLLFLFISFMLSQVDVRGGFVRSELYAGAEHKLRSIPIALQADMIFTSDITFEFGALYRYDIRSEKGLYVLGAGLFSVGGIEEFTLYPGVGYEISRKVSIEAGYGLIGIKEFRAAIVVRL